MKRMFVFLFVLLCLSFIFSYKKPAAFALDNLKGEYSLYVNSKERIECPSFAKVIENGSGQIVSCDSSKISYIKVDLKNVGGESIRLSQSDYTLFDISKLLNFKVKKSYSFSDGLETFYGEADYGSRFVYVGPERINCEIATNNGFIYIGFPVILGSY